MMRLRKRVMVLLLLLVGVAGGMAFSLLGPYKNWQVQLIGYNLPGDIGGPMRPNEGYRWNVPVVTYAYDQSFITYFGRPGMAAIDKAFKILNDLPPVSAITNDGSSLFMYRRRVPTDSTGENLLATAASLRDIKSIALSMVIEEMGLAEPERYVWTIRGRDTFTSGGVTFTNYSIVKYNYDPITFQPSSYVNGVLYTYEIFDPIAPINYADAIESVRDIYNPYTFTSVAGRYLFAGQYYIGLTHDDVGGLRFLLNRNNMAVEDLLPTVSSGLAIVTNIVGGTNITNVSPSVVYPWLPWYGVTNATSFTNILGTNYLIISNTVIAINAGPWTPFFYSTNGFLSGTNIVGATNVTITTNLFNTNLLVSALRPGVNKIRFNQVAYDSLIGQTFTTITNRYTDSAISNRTLLLQPVQRQISQPDILFTAEDLGLVTYLPVLLRRSDTSTWDNNDAINGNAVQGGPGVITPQVTIRFSDQLPYLVNQSPLLTEDSSLIGSGVWASFDGSTNAPIIYPLYLNLRLEDIINQTLQLGP